MMTEEFYIPESREEKTFLIGICHPHESMISAEQTLRELHRLADTAGAKIGGEDLIRLREIHPGNFIGTGHAHAIASITEELGADSVIFDEDLSPAQTRNLEEILEKKILDRTTLILDIFAQHAHSREGKLQVELAQLQYLLPRLRGRGAQLSRLGGGIGTRGPGETKLETDRRRILKRISRLKNDMAEIEKHRSNQRSRPLQKNVPAISLVGYTNAGKSTLLKALTEADVLVEDQLFSTLDPTARKLILPGGRHAVLVDTVGFIRKLPHALVASFKATLEEIKYSDLILMVADASSPTLKEELKASHEVLNLLELEHKNIFTLFNKIDLVEDRSLLAEVMEKNQPCEAVSAVEGTGLDALLNRMARLLSKHRKFCRYRIPYHRFDLLAKLQAEGRNVKVDYRDDCIRVACRLDSVNMERIEQDSDIIRLNKKPPEKERL